jgi:hypothetical protein
VQRILCSGALSLGTYVTKILSLVLYAVGSDSRGVKHGALWLGLIEAMMTTKRQLIPTPQHAMKEKHVTLRQRHMRWTARRWQAHGKGNKNDKMVRSVSRPGDDDDPCFPFICPNLVRCSRSRLVPSLGIAYPPESYYSSRPEHIGEHHLHNLFDGTLSRSRSDLHLHDDHYSSRQHSTPYPRHRPHPATDGPPSSPRHSSRRGVPAMLSTRSP